MTRTVRTAAAVLAIVLLLPACNRGGTAPEEPTTRSEQSTGGEVSADPLTRGLQAHVEGDLDGAVAAYREALQDDPDNKLALYNLGLVQQSQGDNGSAEGNYRRTLDVDPDYTPAMFNLAILRTAAGDNEEAVELYRRVVEIEQDNAGAYLNLGFALRDLGREKEAQEAFDRAVEIDPAMQERIDG